jgi:hypothetical protein
MSRFLLTLTLAFAAAVQLSAGNLLTFKIKNSRTDYPDSSVWLQPNLATVCYSSSCTDTINAGQTVNLTALTPAPSEPHTYLLYTTQNNNAAHKGVRLYFSLGQPIPNDPGGVNGHAANNDMWNIRYDYVEYTADGTTTASMDMTSLEQLGICFTLQSYLNGTQVESFGWKKTLKEIAAAASALSSTAVVGTPGEANFIRVKGASMFPNDWAAGIADAFAKAAGKTVTIAGYCNSPDGGGTAVFTGSFDYTGQRLTIRGKFADNNQPATMDVQAINPISAFKAVPFNGCMVNAYYDSNPAVNLWTGGNDRWNYLFNFVMTGFNTGFWTNQDTCNTSGWTTETEFKSTGNTCNQYSKLIFQSGDSYGDPYSDHMLGSKALLDISPSNVDTVLISILPDNQASGYTRPVGYYAGYQISMPNVLGIKKIVFNNDTSAACPATSNNSVANFPVSAVLGCYNKLSLVYDTSVPIDNCPFFSVYLTPDPSSGTPTAFPVGYTGWSGITVQNVDTADVFWQSVPSSAVNWNFTLSGRVTSNKFTTPGSATLTMAVSPSGSGTTTPVAGASSVTISAPQIITATPAAGYRFVNWTADSGNATIFDSAKAKTSVILTGSATVTANFSQTANLTMAVSPSGAGTTTPTQGTITPLTVGTAQSITAAAGAGYAFYGWFASGLATIANPASASTSVTLSDNATVTALFIASSSTATLTTGVSPSGAGTASPASGSIPVSLYTPISATPNSGYTFLYWLASGGATVASSTNSGASVSLSSAGSATATFSSQVGLTMAVNPSGTTTPPVSPTILYLPVGTVQPITATPASGYTFWAWTVTTGSATIDNPYSSSANLTLTGASNSVIVTAFFVQSSLVSNLTMAVSGSGTTTPSAGTLPVYTNCGFDVIATPAGGQTFSSWSVTGGATVASASSASTTAVLTAAGTITANFTGSSTVSLTMAANPAGAGATIPPAGTSQVTPNTPVNITATASTNFKFSSWGVSGGATVASASSPSTTATLTANGTVTANFIKIPINDFNLDYLSDLLFRNTNGTLITYYMNGTSMKQYVYPVLGAGDVPIEIGDFNGDGYADILARNSSNNTVSVYLMQGATILSSAVLLSNASTWRVMGAADFNCDGKCDLIWQNTSTGQAVIYLMNGTSYSSWGVVYDGSDPAWKVKGVGDLNGDGYADIVWRHDSTGQVIGYLMSGLTILSTGTIYDGANPSWAPVGVGDLNGDGKCDIVWRNSSTGQIIAYLMNGFTIISWGVIYDGSGGLRVVCLGDYNGDGMIDIALRDNSTGNVLIYLMSGLNISSQGYAYSGGDPNWAVVGYGEAITASLTMAVSGSGSVSPSAGTYQVPVSEPQAITATAASGYKFTGWTATANAIVASASSAQTLVTLFADATVTASFAPNTSAPFDYNADGKSDLLWRNTSNGYVAMWLMNGALALSAGIIFDSDATWVPKGKGDFNGDGKCDIVWQRSTTGAVAMWFMNGLSTIGTGYVSGGPASSAIAGVGDFNGDGYADLLWRGADGSVTMTLMNGSSIISSMLIFAGGTTWVPCGTGDFNGDGKCDILWTDTSSGNAAMWLMNGLSTLGSQIIFIGSQGWTPKSCGDYNGDGYCDISWQNSSGNAAVWLMNGFATLSSGFIYQGGDVTWQIMDSGDYNADGRCDIVWRNSGSGQAVMYFMNGITVTGWTVIFNGDTNWTIVK